MFFKKDTGKYSSLTYYKCNKSGYSNVKCSLLKKDRNNGNKVMKIIWNDSIDNDMSNE